MRAGICKAELSKEYLTDERCFILEVANDDGDASVSIARARVAPGVATQFHKVMGTEERYIIISGEGSVEVGELPPANVACGDVVRIPAGVKQRITNTGKTDLIFFCVCTPPFQQDAYVTLAD